MHKIHRPSFIDATGQPLRRLPVGRTDATPGSPLPQLQTQLAIQAMHPFVVDAPAFSPQQDIDPLVAITDASQGQLPNALLERFLGRSATPIPLHGT